MTFGYLATMRTQPGRAAEVVAVLVGGADGLRAAGCRAYVVGTAADDPDLVVVSELWGSKTQHDDSLRLPETRAAIDVVMPMLTGEFTTQEYDVAGGLGA